MDLQQRGVEFAQLFGTYTHMRSGLLEKMPVMQISRMSSQNGESSGGSYDDNSPDLIENGFRDVNQQNDNNIKKTMSENTVN